MYTFSEFMYLQFEKKATGNIKLLQVRINPALDTEMCVREVDSLHNIRSVGDRFSLNSALFNLHTRNGTYWVSFVDKFYFDSSGCALLEQIHKYIETKHEICILPEHQFQRKQSLW